MQFVRLTGVSSVPSCEGTRSLKKCGHKHEPIHPSTFTIIQMKEVGLMQSLADAEFQSYFTHFGLDRGQFDFLIL